MINLEALILISFSLIGLMVIASFASSILIGIFELIGDVFGGSSSSNQYRPPKIVYKKKSKSIEDLLKNKIASYETLPTLYIHDNYPIKAKVSHLAHEKYIEFMRLCDVIEERDGRITNVEIILIGLTQGYMKKTPSKYNHKEAILFNALLDGM